MPELPEVETSRRGISPHIINAKVKDVRIHFPTLRWPIEPRLPTILKKQTLHDIQRRGKYLILCFDTGSLLLHLGMSGNLKILTQNTPLLKHDHFEIIFDNQKILRLHDPRRFGAVLWCDSAWEQHELIKNLGPEPLGPDFDSNYLYRESRNKTVAVKNFIMNSQVVVGVGNIYASESLFLAGINPKRKANKISAERYVTLTAAIKKVLQNAIKMGGTTLKDFVDPQGNKGYFSLKLNVYGREGEACPHCGHSIKHCVIGQRASYYCPQCQR